MLVGLDLRSIASVFDGTVFSVFYQRKIQLNRNHGGAIGRRARGDVSLYFDHHYQDNNKKKSEMTTGGGYEVY